MDDLFSWLKEEKRFPKIFWKNRSNNDCFASVGEKTFGDCAFCWRHFSSTSSPHWIDFPSEMTLYPELIKKASFQTHLPTWTPPTLSAPTLMPGKNLWLNLVDKTLRTIEAQQLKKCVLARECLYSCSSPINPWDFTQILGSSLQNAYLICIQPTPRSSFISMTPEKLFSKEGSHLSTEALAGTQHRDAHASKEFLTHKKQEAEFFLVEKSIQEALSPLLSQPLSFSSPFIRSVSGSLKHLYSRIKGFLKKGVTDEEILSVLHPTAALLGLPKQKALAFLQTHEPFERGLYGAPLGRQEGSFSEWAVGIRSCLLFESTIRLYSGAGIVEGSDPLLEWKELDQKIGVLCSHLRL